MQVFNLIKSFKEFLVIPALALLVVVLGGAAYLWGIQPERQPGCPAYRIWLRDMCEYTRTFSANELLVDTVFFPPDVEVIPFGEVARHGAIERFEVVIHSADGDPIGGHGISRWQWAIRAEEFFANQVEYQFRPDLFPCCITGDLEYVSPVANQFRANCSISGVCIAVAQYQDYVSVFEMEIGSDYTLVDFEQTLSDIDERMIEHLVFED